MYGSEKVKDVVTLGLRNSLPSIANPEIMMIR